MASRSQLQRKQAIFVVVRAIAGPDGPRELRDRLALVAAYTDPDEATSEVGRLNDLNAGKGYEYFWLPAKFFPDGRHVIVDY